MLVISSRVSIKRGVFKSLRFTLLVSFSLLAITLLVSFALLSYKSYEKKAVEQRSGFITNQSAILVNQLVSGKYFHGGVTDTMNSQIEQLANLLNGRIMVINSECKVVKDTYSIDEGRYVMSPNLLDIVDGNVKENINSVISSSSMETYLPIYADVTDDDDENKKSLVGVLLVMSSLTDVYNMLDYLQEKSVNLMVVFAVCIFLVAAVLTNVLTSQFRLFKKSIRSSADGHLDEEFMIHGYTEMKEVAQAFDDIVKKTSKLEASRQEFVSNVSHELKTPITSIKVLADSLLEQEDVPVEMYHEFMVDIVDELDRENSIINDLLTLVKMDRKAADYLNISTVNINELIEMLLKRLRPLAAKRNIEIVYESFREVIAEIDEVKFSQACTNLVENAIKYNVDDGNIRVSLNADHKYFYVKVADSGVGIPEDCTDQIFQRFYRVDKARSRDTGGTGLGLAITKSAIELHKGSIKVHSKLGEGTTFTVRIPLTYVPVANEKEGEA